MTFYWGFKIVEGRTKASDFTNIPRTWYWVAVLYKAWSGHRWTRKNIVKSR